MFYSDFGTNICACAAHPQQGNVTTPGNEPAPNQRMPLSELARHIPGKPVYQTVRCWVRFGKMGPFGQRVYLESRMTPNGYVSCLAWYDQFIERLSGNDRSPSPTPPKSIRRAK